MKALREYFTKENLKIIAILAFGIYMAIAGHPSVFMLCVIYLELRDIKELLEDE